MATMNVSLPDSMKQWVELQAKDGRYSNASDYVRELIRRDQEQAAKIAQLQQRVSEGFASGTGERTMAQLAAEAMARMGA
ncbi:MAG: type II toxin-antitoxin system ParD family antitoxin [Alishewanella aestuarii]